MKPSRIKMYKKMLLEEKARLLNGVRKDNGWDRPKGMEEIAGDLTIDEVRMGLTEKELRILDQVESALDRIENGTYGKCALCGEPIGEERLKAIPFARLCVSCQSDVEKRREANHKDDGSLFWIERRDEEFTPAAGTTVEEEED
jgi:DnaK suppressor protein